MLKKIYAEWKNKIHWFKMCRNNPIYKICVLLGLASSPSYEMAYHTEDYLRKVLKRNNE